MNNIRCQRCNWQFSDATTETSPTSKCPNCGHADGWWAALVPAGAVAQMPYPPQKQGMSGAKVAIIICCVVFGMLFLGGLFVGILAVAVVPKLADAKKELDIIQVKDQMADLRSIETSSSRKRKLNSKSLKDIGGHELWGKMIEHQIVAVEISGKLVSLSSLSDIKMDPAAFSSINPENCSFTLPKTGELREVISSTGKNRCVIITFNSRNWNNVGNDEILVMWSDGQTPEYLTFEYFRDEWGITQDEWADPAGKLFGKKAPFQNTYE
ncbi:MAG: hypothetical protein L3J82_09445 [Planctomycetes bacterium]|nr:hypothetical protein [Planctomycetota bacterium]